MLHYTAVRRWCIISWQVVLDTYVFGICTTTTTPAAAAAASTSTLVSVGGA